MTPPPDRELTEQIDAALRMARRFSAYSAFDPALEVSDIQQEAVLLALKIRGRYDQQRGSFRTFLAPWLKGHVLRNLRFCGFSGVSHGLDEPNRPPVFVSLDSIDTGILDDRQDDLQAWDVDAMLSRLAVLLDARDLNALVRYADGWSIADIAESMNVSMPTMCRILGRARRQARSTLADWTDRPPDGDRDDRFRADILRALGLSPAMAARIDSGDPPVRIDVEKVIGYLGATQLHPLKPLNWERTVGVPLCGTTVRDRILAALNRFGGAIPSDGRRTIMRTIARVQIITCGMVARVAAAVTLSPGDLLPEEWTQ
ncbi:sigma-70 family RNA polymerase sigma factor [Roseiflexus castenholzii]|uniref:sigma-70 family RNA polymerase sigma factor n=1 Tax=Roseiflexus castenholzii TaxID=120962 RepID=UPI003C7B3EEF